MLPNVFCTGHHLEKGKEESNLHVSGRYTLKSPSVWKLKVRNLRLREQIREETEDSKCMNQ